MSRRLRGHLSSRKRHGWRPVSPRVKMTPDNCTSVCPLPACQCCAILAGLQAVRPSLRCGRCAWTPAAGAAHQNTPETTRKTVKRPRAGRVARSSPRCYRSSPVASIELHPDLAAAAAEHLHSLDYYPTLPVGDSRGGLPHRAPYDRIIATCAVSAISPARIDQLTPGGRIVTDLRGELASSLAVLDKIAPDTVQGRLLDQAGHFMWLRPSSQDPLPTTDRFNVVIDLDEAETIGTDLDPHILNEPGLRVLLSIAEPHLGPITHTHHQTHQAVGCAPRTAGPKSPPAPSPLSPTADHATSGPASNTSPPKGNASADRPGTLRTTTSNRGPLASFC